MFGILGPVPSSSAITIHITCFANIDTPQSGREYLEGAEILLFVELWCNQGINGIGVGDESLLSEYEVQSLDRSFTSENSLFVLIEALEDDTRARYSKSSNFATN